MYLRELKRGQNCSFTWTLSCWRWYLRQTSTWRARALELLCFGIDINCNLYPLILFLTHSATQCALDAKKKPQKTMQAKWATIPCHSLNVTFEFWRWLIKFENQAGVSAGFCYKKRCLINIWERTRFNKLPIYAAGCFKASRIWASWNVISLEMGKECDSKRHTWGCHSTVTTGDLLLWSTSCCWA